MAEILVSASTGAMNSLLKKLAAMLRYEYKLHKDVYENIEFMKDELEAMRAFLLKMPEVEDPDVQAKLRVRAVRELSYDIEDYIDKSMVLIDHEPASRTRGFKEFIDKSKNLLTKLKTQHQIAKDIKGIKKQVIEASERFTRYKVDEGTSKLQNSTIDPRVCAIYKDASDLVGIHEPVEDIIKCFTYEDELAKDLKVVSIVGFGGLGKTTLANQVYRKLAAKFECRAFVSISRNPDMRSILKSLLSQICNQEYVQTDAWDENQIISTIRKLLEKKRIFDYEENCPSHLMEASNAILRKCGGLPLAIITTSSLLANKNTTDQWDRIQRSIGYALAENSDFKGMHKILSLSYFDLPQHLRTCLLFLTIFPEDFRILRMHLIDRWIAEGFIQGDSRQNLYKLGNSYFYELINRSLVQPLEIRIDGQARSCRVHDTIHDFLLSKSIEENFAAIINYPQLTCLSTPDMKVRRLSLIHGHKQSDIIISPSWNLSQLRSLTIFWGAKQLPTFSNFSTLRVLDLWFCAECGLENHHLETVTRLSQLRYLTIQGKKITELPRKFGDLKCLEVLDVIATSVKELPKSTTQLQRLAVLYANDGTKLPDQLKNMQMLEEVVGIDVFRHSMEFLEELCELKNLWRLGINWDIDRLEGESISNVNIWLSSLVSIRRLALTIKEIDQDDLQVLGSIPSLTNLYLCLDPDQNVERSIAISDIHGFQQLELFTFQSTHTGLMFEAGSMPRLGQLSFGINVANFKSTYGGFCLGIQHLSCLTMVSVSTNRLGAKLGDVEAVEDAFRCMVEAHPNQPTLEIETDNLRE
uniref:NB-ARC domain-containing protein n=1 Tax=Oryza glumipatula TaxID=40148 RepID=A0A0D9ZHB7_9ORYZ